MATTTTRLTIDDFEKLPDEVAENHELIDGELIEVSGNNLEHNLIRGLIERVLALFVGGHGLGMVVAEQVYDFGGNAHGPDVSFFGAAKLPLLDLRKRVQRFVPDLAVEIVSPNNPFEEVMRKKERYRKCGTSEVWIVSPEAREVYIYSDGGDRILRADAELTADLLPGFCILVRQLFETL